MNEHWEIFVDGASSGKAGPQPAAAAIWVRVNMVPKHEGGLYLSGTNNYAELTAILLGVRYFVQNAPENATLQIYSDSEWAVYTVAAKLGLPLTHYATEHYHDLYHEICELWNKKRMKITVIPREQNEKADSLAKAIKKRGY